MKRVTGDDLLKLGFTPGRSVGVALKLIHQHRDALGERVLEDDLRAILKEPNAYKDHTHWAMLAEAAKWSRRNAATLVDTHWLGGDPKKLEVYGWASWSPGRGIITLRNPSGNQQSFALDVGPAFELPPDAPRQFMARSPWFRDSGRSAIRFRAGTERAMLLAPFEVLTLEAEPSS